MNNALDTRVSKLSALLRAGVLAAVIALAAGCASNDQQQEAIDNLTDAYTTATNQVFDAIPI